MDAHITCHDGQLLPMSAAIWFGALLTGCNGMADDACKSMLQFSGNGTVIATSKMMSDS